MIERTDALHALLSAEHLVKRFGTLTAVDDLSLTVREGEIFALLGTERRRKNRHHFHFVRAA